METRGSWVNVEEVEQNKQMPLSQLIDNWYQYHGYQLSSASKFHRGMLRTAERLGDPPTNRLNPQQLLEYRYQRLKEVTPKSMNNEFDLISSAYNRLRRLGVIDCPNPFNWVEKLRPQQRQMSYLNGDEIKRLLRECKRSKNPDLIWIVQLCLRTGARWGEAVHLTRRQLHDNIVTFVKTKSKRRRSIPLDPAFFSSLESHIEALNPTLGLDEPLFTNTRWRMGPARAFGKAVQRAGIELPQGQMTHVLRHSFGAHFVMKGGKVPTLKEALGHADIKTTMIYMHLAPDFLDEARQFNPLGT